MTARPSAELGERVTLRQWKLEGAARRGQAETGERFEVEVEGRRLTVSNLGKVLWPRAQFTKGDMIDYYARIAPVLLPHLAERPVTLRRFPEGVEDGYWYQKQCWHHPAWMPTVAVPSVLEEGKVLHYCIVNELPSLVWVANLGAIELHPNLALARDVHVPTTLAFDLDPGPPAGLLDACRVGLELRSLLDQLGIASYPKTSGGKGLHVYVPLNTPHSYAQTKTFAHAVAGLLARRAPEQVVDRMARRLRAGKVFVDWSQNDATKTTVAAYSLRARERPTASTPVTWEEVADALEAGDPHQLYFEANDVAKRVEELGDPFRPVLDLEQRLPSPDQV